MFKQFIKLLVIICFSVVFFTYGYKFLCGKDFFKSKSNFYFIEVEDLNGINGNTPILINGYKVGKIKNINFCYETLKTKIKIAVDKRIKVNKNSIISVQSNLLGGKKLVLDVKTGEELPVNSLIKTEDKKIDIQKTVKNIQQLVEDVKDVSAFLREKISIICNKIEAVMKDIEDTGTYEKIKEIIKDINTIVKEVKEKKPGEITEKVKKTLDFINNFLLDWIKGITEKNKGKSLLKFSF